MQLDYNYYYRKWHPDTVEHRAAMVGYYKRILAEALPKNKAARILDVGCGMGFALLALQELDYKSVAGVDSDRGQVDACRANGLDVTLAPDTIEFLRKKAGSLEVLLACDLLEHIPPATQVEFVQAMAGALVPGGSLLCTVPNANSVLAARWRYIDWTHCVSFTESSLDFLLHSGGFSDIQISGVEFFERPKYFWLPLSGGRHWWAFRFFRTWRRLQMIAELGPEQGRAVPLSLNLFCSARKP